MVVWGQYSAWSIMASMISRGSLVKRSLFTERTSDTLGPLKRGGGEASLLMLREEGVSAMVVLDKLRMLICDCVCLCFITKVLN